MLGSSAEPMCWKHENCVESHAESLIKTPAGELINLLRFRAIMIGGDYDYVMQCCRLLRAREFLPRPTRACAVRARTQRARRERGGNVLSWATGSWSWMFSLLLDYSLLLHHNLHLLPTTQLSLSFSVLKVLYTNQQCQCKLKGSKFCQLIGIITSIGMLIKERDEQKCSHVQKQKN